MTAFTSDQWPLVGLIFLLGLIIGMFLLAGGRWKRRYAEEARLREAAEAENARLRSELAERDSLRAAAVRNPGTPVTDPPPL